MPLTLNRGEARDWDVRKIAVLGPGIVGMPMAALLAHARILEGSDRPAPVVVVQRASATSAWKVDAINRGESPIGGVEPDLDRIVREAWQAGLLSASHDYAALRDADLILVCVQTDKAGFAPDYGPLMEALSGVAAALQSRPAGNVPVLVIESTLAPSSMATVVREHFAGFGLVEGRDVLLGNSPNRVMPGRLVERVAASDKLVAGLSPATPLLVERVYRHIVTRGTLHRTNSLTAEVVKTLENAYRDVRIAYAAEIVRFCDEHDIDFFRLRDAVNVRLAQADTASADPGTIPSGGLLVPTVGVGGHCLPKDGILLWWRKLESGADSSASLILEARRINDESPAETLRLAERAFGALKGHRIALLGAAYRFDSEDTRNSPTLTLARLLLDRGSEVAIHDPYVKPDDQNVKKFGLESRFTRDLDRAVGGAELLFACTAHRVYAERRAEIVRMARQAHGIVDACNLYRRADFAGSGLGYAGVGRGSREPQPEFADFVYGGFQAMERGLANELASVLDFLNDHYARDDFGRLRFEEVQRLAGTCVTGCVIAEPGPIAPAKPYRTFVPRLVRLAGIGSV
ncbi:MAG: nucleotide sugar dehydrogenase [Gemmatimonadales bacterium]|jgi:UDP-N-acetyl-D-mannosaminuronic acid dehydrogenase